MRKRYGEAGKAKKTWILDQVCDVAGFSRDHARRVMTGRSRVRNRHFQGTRGYEHTNGTFRGLHFSSQDLLHNLIEQKCQVPRPFEPEADPEELEAPDFTDADFSDGT